MRTTAFRSLVLFLVPLVSLPACERTQRETGGTAKTVTEQLAAPAGTIITVALDQPISTANAQAGQEVRAHVVNDVPAGQQAAIKAGAPVNGKVVEVKSSGRVKGLAALALDFSLVQTVGGWQTIHAHMVEGTLEAEGTKKRDVATIGVGAAAGAVLGEIFADKAKMGAVIGAAAGTAVVLTTKGKELELQAGTQLELQLDQPLLVTVTRTGPLTD